jgi:RimJ/RimL family protein N-acetyltransferase
MNCAHEWEFALRRMGVHRIRCTAAIDNYPSLRVISRLGFRFETHREPGAGASREVRPARAQRSSETSSFCSASRSAGLIKW